MVAPGQERRRNQNGTRAYNGGLCKEIELTILESRLKRDDEYQRRLDHWRTTLKDLRSEEAEIHLGGGVKALQRQQDKGKMSARERVAVLCDPDSEFVELGLWAAHGLYEEYGGAPAAGVVTGIGKIHERDVVVVSNDATVKAGAWFP